MIIVITVINIITPTPLIIYNLYFCSIFPTDITRTVSGPYLLRIYSFGADTEQVRPRHGPGAVRTKKCSKTPFTSM